MKTIILVILLCIYCPKGYVHGDDNGSKNETTCKARCATAFAIEVAKLRKMQQEEAAIAERKRKHLEEEAKVYKPTAGIPGGARFSGDQPRVRVIEYPYIAPANVGTFPGIRTIRSGSCNSGG